MQVDSIEADFLGHHENLTPPTPSEGQSNEKPFSINFHPGFFCFFQKYTQSKELTYTECYNRVMRSHFQLQKLRNPVQKLFIKSGVSLQQRSEQLYLRSGEKQRFYIQMRGDKLFKYSYGQEKQNQIDQLQKQLELYQKRGVDALEEKRKQFKKLREEQQALKLREEEEKQRRQKVLDEMYSLINSRQKK